MRIDCLILRLNRFIIKASSQLSDLHRQFFAIYWKDTLQDDEVLHHITDDCFHCLFTATAAEKLCYISWLCEDVVYLGRLDRPRGVRGARG